MSTTPDYSLLGQARISQAGFSAILKAAASPALAEAATCYKAFTAAGVDPAVGLAIFRKESTFGKYGYAHDNRSWGNIREPSTGKFRHYPTWTAGAADAARLLVIYGTNRIRPGTKTDTVQTFPYVWAPAADGNAPDAYGDALASWIHDWAAKYPPVARPKGTTGRAHANGLRRLFTVHDGRAAEVGYSGLRFTAYISAPAHYLPNATLRKILSGSHIGFYVHPGDKGLTIENL
jgi:hypothetical protein